MGKPRRTAKKVNYSALQNGDSDCEDFWPTVSKKKRHEESKENPLKSDNESSTYSPRLSPAEKRFKGDLEEAINISSSSDENANRPVVKKTTTDEDPMPGTSWGLTAKRQRKQVKSYNESDPDSNEEFEGWNESSDDSDFSPASPVLNKKCKKQPVKRREMIKTDSRTIDAKPVKTIKTNDPAVAEEIMEQLTAEDGPLPSVEDIDDAPEKSEVDKDLDSSDEQSNANKLPANETAVELADKQICSVSGVKPAGPIITNPTSPVLVRSTISPNILSTTKEKLNKTSSTSIAKVNKCSSNKPIANLNSDKNGLTNKMASSTTSKSSFRSPLIAAKSPTNDNASSSPKTGLRLGLSRKGIFKPLHPRASLS